MTAAPRRRAPRGSGSVTPVPARGVDVYLIRWSDHGPRQEYFRGRRSDADERLRAIVADRDRGVSNGGGSGTVTVGQWCATWDRDYLGGMMVGTARRYRDTLRLYVGVPTVDGRPVGKPDPITRVRLSKLAPPDVAAFHSRLVARGLSHNHRAQILATLSSSLTAAQDARLVHRNAVKDLRGKPRQQPATIVPPTVAEVDAILADVIDEDPRTRALYYVALGAGIRESELIGLTWADRRRTAADAPALFVQRKREYRTRQVETPKQHSVRLVEIDAGVDAALDELRRYQLATGTAGGDGLIFTTRTGGPLHPRNVLRDLHDRCARLGITRYSWHTLRHAYATRLLADGTDLDRLRANLGHKQLATTARYVHGGPTRDSLRFPMPAPVEVAR